MDWRRSPEVTTDFTGAGFEVTVKKSDGSTVEVHLDKSFNVIQRGPGRHGGHGHFGPPSSGSSNGSSSGSGSGSSDSSNLAPADGNTVGA